MIMMASTKYPLDLTVNGQKYSLQIDPRRALSEVIRYELGLTGTKEGCNTGNCGACTVLLEGKPIKSCLMFGLQANGKSLETIESLAKHDKLHPVQQSFIDSFAIQCGYCIPGMMLASVALLRENPNPTEEEVREAVSGNICRCTGYTKIFEAVLAAAKMMRGG